LIKELSCCVIVFQSIDFATSAGNSFCKISAVVAGIHFQQPQALIRSLPQVIHGDKTFMEIKLMGKALDQDCLREDHIPKLLLHKI